MSEMNEHKIRVLVTDSEYVIKNLNKLISKINKKAEKYGVDPITMAVGDKYFVSVKNRDGVTSEKYFVQDVTVSYTPVTIKGGWYVLGSVEKTEGEWNIINGKIDNIGNLKQYDMSWCDHCNKKRNRKKVIVLQDQDGNRKIVGRQCVKDYLGISIAHAVFAADFQSIIESSFNEYDMEEGCREGRPECYTDIDLLARVTAAVLEKDKWAYYSSKYCNEENSYNTPCSVMQTLFDIRLGYTQDGRNKVPFSINDFCTEKSDKVSKEILEELREEFTEESIKTLDNSFDYDLAVMLNLGYTKQEKYFVGMMGYRISKRMESQKVTKRDPKKSNYYGTVGEKIKKVDVELSKTRWCESDWGSSLMVCGYFKGSDDQFVAFLNGKTDWLFENETLKDEVSIAATVKKHDDRGYGKQTSLTRMRAAK